jgi:hypothetical protein
MSMYNVNFMATNFVNVMPTLFVEVLADERQYARVVCCAHISGYVLTFIGRRKPVSVRCLGLSGLVGARHTKVSHQARAN